MVKPLPHPLMFHDLEPHLRSPTGLKKSTGFTLMEVLLVLALLVTISAIMYPSLEGMFASMRLKQMGDQLATAWTEARITAVESGEIIAFRYQLNGAEYKFSPLQNMTLERRSSEDRLQTSTPEQTSESGLFQLQIQTKQGSFVQGILFFKGEHSEEVRLLETDLVTDNLKQTEQVSWAPPILFRPDGTSSDVAILLKNEQEQYIRVTLRGITGIARVSGILTEKEIQE